ncbi:hypothetical protein BT93_B1356 [Corymbia citriodora subsp. variegata]|nr:hypothetical protein BT93_B1356 [Corymbia citriodora subsp. variegata]
MDDHAVDVLSQTFDRIVLNSAAKPPAACRYGLERVEGSENSIDDTAGYSGNRESSPDEGQTLPILQKIISLSSKIQDLRKEHTALSDEVKGITPSAFAGPELIDTLDQFSKENERLKKKYLDESSERKRLYNEVIELKGNIRVFCRCRPLNSEEIASGSACVVEFDPAQDSELQVLSSDSSKKPFKFDHVFKPEDSQEAVFAQTKPIIASVMDGYNICIFAYGQTGTGKTFTMEGTQDNRGVNYRTLEELFQISEERNGIMRYELFVSMLEVYNEKIRDLLVESSEQPAKKLEIKQAAEGTQEVPGLVESRVFHTEEVWELLKSGSRARAVGSTSANELSSRSHCLLRVTVKGENLINGQKTKSHLWMVDLAGSERVGRIEVEGDRLKESQYINKSLSALGDVISALASKSAHIPYRNSKLTHMLQSSLGGDCKTLMFVQISPSSADLGETLCSLNFASRVRGVESGPARKQADVSELFKYKQMVEKLKHDDKETKKLQENLQSLQLRLAAREHTCRSLQEKVRDLEHQLTEERKTRLKQETRALTVASTQSKAMPSYRQPPLKTIAEKRPPLVPSKMRQPLRRITNFLPPPSPSYRSVSKGPIFAVDKENIARAGAAANSKSLMKPRRISIATGRAPPSTGQVFQPRRRVSIATLRPESNLHLSTPLRTNSLLPNASSVNRQSFVKDPRKARYSRLFSPMPGVKPASETTPVAMKSSSKFMGSPPTQQVGSWKPKHPTVVALQRKSVVWSPLKWRGMKNMKRPSLLPSRPSSEMQ